MSAVLDLARRAPRGGHASEPVIEVPADQFARVAILQRAGAAAARFLDELGWRLIHDRRRRNF